MVGCRVKPGMAEERVISFVAALRAVHRRKICIHKSRTSATLVASEGAWDAGPDQSAAQGGDIVLTVRTASDLSSFVGRQLGVSPWVTVDQDKIDRFGAVTGETHWTHVDVERARRELPFKSTIAQGFLTLSLTTALTRDIFHIERAGRILNYGLDRVRFTNIVVPGTNVRLVLSLQALQAQGDGGVRITVACVMEIEGEQRPALVADLIFVVYE
jgi:acyl dehydratase